LVTYVDARYGGPHWEFNQFARAMRDDLQLVASEVYTPTVIEDFDHILWLFENRPLTADEIAGRVQGYTKPWAHYVDIYRYEPGAFAADPLPDLTGLLDTPDEARNFDLPQPQVEVGADFGGQVTLLGYDLEREGTAAIFTFYWQATRWMPEPYHAFVHVAEAAGQAPAAGQDIVPRENGAYPMPWWAPGEVVSDTLAVDLSAVAPGVYVVGTGLYEFNSGARLAATDASGAVYQDGWLPLIEGLTP